MALFTTDGDKAAYKMIIPILLIGVVTALAVFAILAKTCAGDPNRAEPWGKGDVLKLLLAKSEREFRQKPTGRTP